MRWCRVTSLWGVAYFDRMAQVHGGSSGGVYCLTGVPYPGGGSLQSKVRGEDDTWQLLYTGNPLKSRVVVQNTSIRT